MAIDMATIRLIAAALTLALSVAAAVPPAGAAFTATTGVVPVQLSDAETSYLGVRLALRCGGSIRPMQDARLPVTNDGSNLAIWGSSIPLRAVATRTVGPYTEVRVMPFAFNLTGPRAWTDACGDFTYVVRLNPDVVQPQSLLYFANNASFDGTLYVAAVLRMTDRATGAVFEQALNLALNVGGKWVNEPAVSVLDGDLSSILPFARRDSGGVLKNDYTCVDETHPMGYYCLQTSADLLFALDGR